MRSSPTASSRPSSPTTGLAPSPAKNVPCPGRHERAVLVARRCGRRRRRRPPRARPPRLPPARSRRACTSRPAPERAARTSSSPSMPAKTSPSPPRALSRLVCATTTAMPSRAARSAARRRRVVGEPRRAARREGMMREHAPGSPGAGGVERFVVGLERDEHGRSTGAPGEPTCRPTLSHGSASSNGASLSTRAMRSETSTDRVYHRAAGPPSLAFSSTARRWGAAPPRPSRPPQHSPALHHERSMATIGNASAGIRCACSHDLGRHHEAIVPTRSPDCEACASSQCSSVPITALLVSLTALLVFAALAALVAPPAARAGRPHPVALLGCPTSRTPTPCRAT